MSRETEYGMQWSTLTNICKNNATALDSTKKLYSEVNFPYKIRSTFAQWIESKPWDKIGENEEGAKQAQNLYKELLMMLEDWLRGINSQAQGFELDKTLEWQQVIQNYKTYFDGNYLTFVSVVRACLERERDLIQFYMTDNSDRKRKDANACRSSPEDLELKKKIDALLHEILDVSSLTSYYRTETNLSTDTKRDDFSNRQTVFVRFHEDITEKIRQLQGGEGARDVAEMKEKMLRERNQHRLNIYERRKALVNSYITIYNTLYEILDEVWKRIVQWNTEQKRSVANLEIPNPGAIDSIDKLCEGVNSILLKLISQLDCFRVVIAEINFEKDSSSDDIQRMLDDARGDLLQKHLNKILVVEKNIPDRVLKVSSGKSLGFSMAVRLLGGNSLGINSNLPKVRISLYENGHIPDGDSAPESETSCCLIVNGGNLEGKPLQQNRGTNSYTAQFQNLTLKNMRRPDKGKNEELLVTEHKYAFVFYTKLQLFQKTYNIKTISLPVILTSQTSQEIMAKGTLIWDAAFSEDEREPFKYQEAVPWKEFSEVLVALFKNNTGRGLDKEHLDYLAAMALRSSNSRKTDKPGNIDETLVNEKLVIRDKLKGKEFSFWKWVCACMNLVKNHVKEEWVDGIIYGFISKDSARKQLQNNNIGTFLLRFSETNIEDSQRADISGSLTLAVMEIDPSSGRKKLFHIKEYLSPKEILEKGLSNILNAMEVADYTNNEKKKPLLMSLWPYTNKSFNEIFGKYLKEKDGRLGVMSSDGYVGRKSKYTIEIFLSDDSAVPSGRGRTDSMSTEGGMSVGAGEASISNPPSVQSNLSIGSPCSSEFSVLSEVIEMNNTSAHGMPKVARLQPSTQAAGRMVMQPIQLPDVTQLQVRPRQPITAAVRPQNFQFIAPAAPANQQQNISQLILIQQQQLQGRGVYQPILPQQQIPVTYQQLQLMGIQQQQQQQQQQVTLSDNLSFILNDVHVGSEGSPDYADTMNDELYAGFPGLTEEELTSMSQFVLDGDGDMILPPSLNIEDSMEHQLQLNSDIN